MKDSITLFSRGDCYEVTFKGKDYHVVYEWDTDGYYQVDVYDSNDVKLSEDSDEREEVIEYFTENNKE